MTALFSFLCFFTGMFFGAGLMKARQSFDSFLVELDAEKNNWFDEQEKVIPFRKWPKEKPP